MIAFPFAGRAKVRDAFSTSVRAGPVLRTYPLPIASSVAVKKDSIRGSSVKLGPIERRLAWPLREDDTHTSRSVSHFVICGGEKASRRLSDGVGTTVVFADVPQNPIHLSLQLIDGWVIALKFQTPRVT